MFLFCTFFLYLQYDVKIIKKVSIPAVEPICQPNVDERMVANNLKTEKVLGWSGLFEQDLDPGSGLRKTDPEVIRLQNKYPWKKDK